MDLSSVPFFKRPIQSSAKDQWIGQDEAGNNVYKMSNGQTYTVKPDADQRTTRTKVEEDVIPAVKEYAEDPSLPSAEDMKQFGMDVATGAYESLKGAVEGTGTMGDVFGVAPAMAALGAGAKVPEGAIRSFGGLSEGALDSLKEYNEGVRIPKGLLDRDMVNKNDNILYRPDRSYRFIGKEGFEDFQSSGLIRARPGSKQGYEVPYFMKGKSSSRYGQGEGGEYLVETVPTGDWKNAASADDKYHGPTNPLTKEDPIRIFKRNESGEFEVVFDNIGDEALLTSLEPKGFNQGGSVSMDLKNVPFFNRPMGASEKDQWVGQDEAGNNVYKMGNGSTYTVKPDADQRTTRTKIEEDVIPAIKDFAKNPSLPSTEQMKQFGVDVAQGTYDSIKGAVEGTGTMGDVFGVAPAMAVGSAAFDVPEDALRLFGGQRARQANREDLKEFVKRYRGKTPEEQKQLWEELGWGKNTRGDVRFEIDDSSFSYKGVPEPRTFYELGNVIEHEELFNNYPELKSILISEQTAYDPQEIMGEMRMLSDNTPYINIAADMTPEEKKLTILHELQHVIQTAEDPDFEAKYNRESSYQGNPAEIEAFAVEPRADMTKEQRRKTMPNFAEGGSVEAQMQELRVDPVSGNEVPPGSLPEEVRDDVDAKLSEGEYVVPADVVRFFGVGYFEKLREKAKKALAEMDADGRIGGEPVPEGEDDFPFSDDELMTVDVGAEAPVGMAEGGVVSGFNPQLFQPGFSTQGSGVQTKTYINKEGQQRAIIFVNGQPIQQIPAGFVEATAENRAELTKQQSPVAISTGEVKTEFSGEGPDGSGVGTGGGQGGGARGYDVNDPLGAAQDALDGKASSMIGGLLGTVVGSVVGAPGLGGRLGKGVGQANSVANAAANAEIASILGYDTKDIDKAIEDATKGKLAKSMTDRARENAKENFFNSMLGVNAPIAFDQTSFQTTAAYEAAKDNLARAAEKSSGLAPGSAVAMGQGLGDSSAGFESDFAAAQAHAEANPTGVTTGSPLGLDQAFGPGGSSSSPSISTSGGYGGGSSGGSSGSSGGFGGGMGDGPGYGGWAARGMLVDKKVRQKQVNPKPEGKGLVKRKAKK